MKQNKNLIISLVVGAFVILGIIGGIVWWQLTKDKTTTQTTPTEEIALNGDLVVGMELEYAPLEWVTMGNNEQYKDQIHPIQGKKNGFACGYNVAIAKKLAKKLSKKLIIKKIDFDGLFNALTSNEVDLVIAGHTKTPEREETVAFSDPYHFGSVKVILQKDLEVNNLADLKEKKIAYQKDSAHEKKAKMISDHTQELQDLNAFNLGLLAKTIDGYILESDVAELFISKNPTLAKSVPKIDNQLMEKTKEYYDSNPQLTKEECQTFQNTKQSHIAIKKENEKLTKEVNKALEELHFTQDNQTTQALKLKAVQHSKDENANL
ncbi:MAG: SAP52-like protein [Candidatus Phytoplasma asteris]|nr:MAG: ABC-type amino acid transport system substrate-binding component [Periwinkle leaf yellowing phytoplasma]WEX19698.1 MAG: SAP52-like protein [Candidatus Phytoplasma asteris]